MGTMNDFCLWKGSCPGPINAIILHRLEIQLEEYMWAQKGKIRNKSMRTLNGNIAKGVQIMHWNLGSRFWDKKRMDIQHLADQYSPDYLYISEANLFHDTPDHLREIEGYKMALARTMESLKFSRIVLLCKEGAQYTVETNLMSKEMSSIWVKLSGKGRKTLLLGGGIQGSLQYETRRSQY